MLLFDCCTGGKLIDFKLSRDWPAAVHHTVTDRLEHKFPNLHMLQPRRASSQPSTRVILWSSSIALEANTLRYISAFPHFSFSFAYLR